MEILSTLILGGFALISTVFFSWQSGKREHHRLLKELFTEFNKRYSELNDCLEETRQKSYQMLSPSEKSCVHEYANLCAEEFYWYNEGRLDDKIWKAWLAGMKSWYVDNLAFKEYWDNQLQSELRRSFYLSEVEKDFITGKGYNPKETH